MEKKNKDILKKGLMETNVDFTSDLMNKINAEEEALSTVLSKNGIIETSDDFTLQLMSKLEGKVPAKPYTAVISKRAWIGISAVFASMVLLVLFTFDQEGNSIKYDLGLDRLTDNFLLLFNYSPVLTYVSFGLLLLTLSLLVEQRLRKKI